MKTGILAAAALLAAAANATAADLGAMKAPAPAPTAGSPWDYAFGAGIRSDYNFRGISQSDRGPGVFTYGELRYNFAPNWQGYVNVTGASVKLATRPSMEIDVSAGIRPTFGPLAFDFGAMAYLYPRETMLQDVNLGGPPPLFALTPSNTDFFEVYGKATYTFNDMFSVGAGVYHSPNWLNLGATGTYVSGNAKINLPHGFAVSGELGRYFLGTTDLYLGAVNLPDYTYWNAGLSYKWKFATLDLRYHGTSANKNECWALTGDPRGASPLATIAGNGSGRSRWCGDAFIATLQFDLEAKDIR